jgi:hypothetical protein
MANPLAPASISFRQVFPEAPQGDDEYMLFEPEVGPVSYFVGRNGSGKSRTGRAIASAYDGQYLSTDRLLGLMNTTNYGWGVIPEDYKGPPLDEFRPVIASQSRSAGLATDLLLALRDHPEVGLKVAAFMRTALGRTIEFRENGGFFDPYLRLGGVEYSLFRDEGHGLRELTVLLAAAYMTDWNILIVDEPELHLHPSLARLWLAELNRECRERDAKAVVVTHEPSMLRPTSAADLGAVWHFRPGHKPSTIGSHVPEQREERVTAGLKYNPQLLSQLAFAPRPVLVEGVHDVAALTAALSRTKEPAVVAQTELVPCGSSGAVALWFEIGKSMGIDLRAVADLDAIFSGDVQRTIDRSPDLQRRYREELFAEPPTASVAIRPLIDAANAGGVEKSERARARWLADLSSDKSGIVSRRNKLLEVWRENGLWLHPQGTLEDVLRIEKGKADPGAAASVPGDIDAVADWCAYELDPLGDLRRLVGSTVERIANALTLAQGEDPAAVFTGPVGTMATSDAKLVTVEQVAPGRYRITVKAPAQFAGYYVEVDRETPPSSIALVDPSADA